MTKYKEGVEATIGFIKYIVTVSGGAIAFAVQPSFYNFSLLVKVMSTISILLLTASIIAGFFVHSRGCVMLSDGKYDLDDPHMKVPGLCNLGTFALGLTLFAICVWLVMWDIK